MSKLIKYPLIILGALIALFVVAAIIFTTLISPKDALKYADNSIYQKTGHHLTIKGKASWSFFPWLGFDATQLEISNSPGFQGPALASIGEMQIRVKLIPLFSGKIQVGDVVVKNSNFNLITNKAGVNNWQNPAGNKAEPASDASDAVKAAPIAISVASIDIQNANVNLSNQQAGSATRIQKFNLTTGEINGPRDIQIKSSLQLLSAQAAGTVNNISFNGVLHTDSVNQSFSIPNLNLQNRISRPKLSDLLVKLSGALQVNFKNQTAAINNLQISVANLILSGKFSAANIFATPAFNFNLVSNSASVAELSRAINGSAGASGSLKLNISGSTSGGSSTALIKNLNGSGQFNLDGLALATKMNQYINDGISRSKRGGTYNGDNTKYVSISAPFSIRNGILYNSSLSTSLKSPRISGSGQVNLMSQAVSYRLNASMTLSIDKQQIPISFPIYVGGTISNLTFNPDTNAIAGQIVAYFAKSLLQNGIKNLLQGPQGGGSKIPIKIPFFGN